MNPNEQSNETRPSVRPGFRVTVLRLALIALVMSPLSFAASRILYALSVGNWDSLDSSVNPMGRFWEWMVAWGGSVCAVFLASQSPTICRLFSRRNLRRMFFGLACFVTLIALFYAEENWRGKRAWDTYRSEREAQGDKFDRQHFIPPRVPDEQNFAMTPFLAPLFDFKPGTQQFRDPNWHQKYELTGLRAIIPEFQATELYRSNSWARSRRDLPALYVAIIEMDTIWKINKPGEINLTNATPQALATAVLAARDPAKSVMEELRTASRRPHSRFNIHYEYADPASILLPHLGILNQLTRVLRIRAAGELTLDRPDDASSDINLMFDLTEAIHSEPILISQLVRFAQLELALQPIAQGLEARQWSDSQLQVFQQRLEAFDFFADAKRGMDAERASYGGGVQGYFRQLSSRERFRHFTAINQWRVPGGADASLQPINSNWLAYYAGVPPIGWYYLEQVNYDQAYQKYLSSVLDVENQRVSPSLVRKANEHLERASSSVNAISEHRLFSVLLLPSLPWVIDRAVQVQTGANLAAIACALERHRLAHGKFPPKLDALVPQFMRKLPHDIINGQPLHYRLTDDGQFVLYSVGWNEKDDGGTIVRNRGEGGTVYRMKYQTGDWNHGDWVWAYPARP